MADEKWQNLIDALGEYFDCDADDITAVVLGVEHKNGDGARFRTTYSGIPWHAEGFLARLEKDIHGEAEV